MGKSFGRECFQEEMLKNTGFIIHFFLPCLMDSNLLYHFLQIGGEREAEILYFCLTYLCVASFAYWEFFIATLSYIYIL